MSKLGTIALQGLSLSSLGSHERAVLRRISDCQTPRMGGNDLDCVCGHREVHYNSCRDRHCPLCQGAARARWVNDRLAELLPTPYFHVVFTVPHQLTSLALTNKRIFYHCLFTSAHETLLEVCANPDNLGAKIGGLSVLHTWNQKLAYHPHLHCIVPGGGVSKEGTKWLAGNPGYLVSVKRLSLVFRGKLLNALEKVLNKNNLIGNTEKIRIDLARASKNSFVVYAKQPFGGPEQVLKYLGRYTHRIGISEQRIISVENSLVKFSYLDRKNGHIRKILTLCLEDFIKKFMLHLLPKAFRKIRYFGYMSNHNRRASIHCVRLLIDPVAKPLDPIKKPPQQPKLCKHCGQPLRLHISFDKTTNVTKYLMPSSTPGPEPSPNVCA